jgi:threonine/homoserine/homoserine lactone efflux protein
VIDTFIIVLPLMLSPGPANLVSFALAARFGFAGTLSFQLGILIVYAIVAVTFGAVANQVTGHAAYATATLQLIGGLFIIYLGFRLACRKRHEVANLGVPSFSNGVLLQVLNPKYPAVVIAVFANRPHESTLTTAGVLSVVGAAGLLGYSFAGSLIHNFSSSEKWLRILDVGFGSLLCIVGIWVVVK